MQHIELLDKGVTDGPKNMIRALVFESAEGMLSDMLISNDFY